MGFGFIEVGTVTPRPQPGNPRPRLFRLPQKEALINRFGFNNVGIDAFVATIERTQWSGVLGVNIGKNADTPAERAADDYELCLRQVYPVASYVTINISSPNTAGLRALQEKESLDHLLGRLSAARENLATRHRQTRPAGAQDRAGPRAQELASDRRSRPAPPARRRHRHQHLGFARRRRGPAARRRGRRPLGPADSESRDHGAQVAEGTAARHHPDRRRRHHERRRRGGEIRRRRGAGAALHRPHLPRPAAWSANAYRHTAGSKGRRASRRALPAMPCARSSGSWWSPVRAPASVSPTTSTASRRYARRSLGMRAGRQGQGAAGIGIPQAASGADRVRLPALRPRSRAARRRARLRRHLHRLRDRRPAERPADPLADVGDRRPARGAGRRLVPAEAERRQRRAAARAGRDSARKSRHRRRRQRRRQRAARRARHRRAGHGVFQIRRSRD